MPSVLHDVGYFVAQQARKLRIVIRDVLKLMMKKDLVAESLCSESLTDPDPIRSSDLRHPCSVRESTATAVRQYTH